MELKSCHNSKINELSSRNNKDAESNNQFPFGNDLKKISSEGNEAAEKHDMYNFYNYISN